MDATTMHYVKEKEVRIPIDGVELEGILAVPENASRLVIFSQGSGSSHLSPRNKMIAEMMNDHGFATLLFDLLTPEEDSIYENRFNIDLLTDRILIATAWVIDHLGPVQLPIGYFGASTGAASAMNAASILGDEIGAVISRGGRPDLATFDVSRITSPVLLIVGEEDRVIISLNHKVYQQLECEKELSIISGATHLFEEPGKLEEVAELSIQWFEQYLEPDTEIHREV